MIIDHCRDIKEFYNLYNSIDSSNLAKPEEILALDDYCFCFYDKNRLVGVIYLEDFENKVYLSGFSKRKNLKNNIEAVQSVCNYFSNDKIYSSTPFKHAAYVLKKAGFKQVNKDTYLYYKE